MGAFDNIKGLLPNKVQNYFFPVNPTQVGAYENPGRQINAKNPGRYIAPVQLQRLKQDTQSWRAGASEAERAFYPHRVKMQQLFIDTKLNGHVTACMDRRKNLTLLKDFAIVDDNGNEDPSTKILQEKWFYTMMSYILDTPFYGYTLIGFGDIIEDKLPNLELIRRWNVSPDRLTLNSYIYMLDGLHFRNPEAKDDEGNSFFDWSAWITTPSENGVSKCGYGLLYKVGIYEIFLRNLLGFNGDFVELFAQPYRVGKTNKTEEKERAELAQTMQNMGSSGWALLDMEDEIEFVESKLGGTGFKGYESFQERLEKTISKVLLGHADAIDSTTGKLGTDGKDDDSVGKALIEIEKHDTAFVEYVMNDEVLPKLRNLGFNFPVGKKFKFKNDKEKQETRTKEDTANQATATVIKTLFDSGVEVDPAYIEERTGIKVTKKAIVEPVLTGKKLSKDIQNKLDFMYGRIK